MYVVRNPILRAMLRLFPSFRELERYFERENWFGKINFWHHDQNGLLLRTWDSHNFMTTEGKTWALNALLRPTASSAAGYDTTYLRLANNTHTRALSDTLSTLSANEITTNLNANFVQYTLNGAPAADGNAMEVSNSSSKAVFTATGAVSNIETVFLTNASTGTTGTLISEAEIDAGGPITLANTETLTIQYDFGISQAAA